MNQAMKPVLYKIIGVGLMLAAYASWLLMRHQALVDQESHYQEVTNQVAQLAVENERLSKLAAQAKSSESAGEDQMNELLRLRRETGQLRQQTNEMAALHEENTQLRDQIATNQASLRSRPGSGANPAGYWPKESWTFRGFATPQDAFLSSLWAANNGDIKTLLNSVTGDTQAQIQKDMENKSESEMAARAQQEVAKMNSCQIISQEPQPDGTVLLNVSLDDGDKSQTAKLIMQQVGADWKLSKPKD
jgi:hypothetical protein